MNPKRKRKCFHGSDAFDFVKRPFRCKNQFQCLANAKKSLSSLTRLEANRLDETVKEI